jgi:hypothetical protein
MIPVESTVPTTTIEGFPNTTELQFDQLTDHVTVQKSIVPSRGPYPFVRSPGEELPIFADLRWKTVTYRLPQEDPRLLTVEICNKRDGSHLRRDLWTDMHIETKLSLAHDIIDLDRAPFTEKDMEDDDTRYDVFQRIHMFGNERFVIVWSHAFVYIMSFDPAFGFEYDEDEISKN